jgi:hypothetical protein
MQSLTACYLFMGQTEEALSTEQLKHLEVEVSDLIEWILNTDISSHITKPIIEGLESILRAIRDYRIRGIAAMQDALTFTIGSMVIANREGQLETHPDLATKVANTISFVANLVTATGFIIQYGPMLPPIIQKFLPYIKP